MDEAVATVITSLFCNARLAIGIAALMVIALALYLLAQFIMAPAMAMILLMALTLGALVFAGWLALLL